MNALESSILFAALEAARIGLCAINSDGDVVLLTADFAKKVDLSPEFVLGRSGRRLLAGDRFSVPNFAELIDPNNGEVAAQATVTARGQFSILLLRGTTLRHPSLGTYRILSIVDTVDLGIAPTRLLETRRQLDALRSAVVISDLRQPDHPICFVNRRFEEMTGYQASEVLGRNCRFLQGPDRTQAGLSGLRDAVAARNSFHVVLRNYRKSGEPFMNELLLTPLFDAKGEASYYMGLQREFGDRQFEL